MSGYIVVLKNKAVESSKLLSQVNLQNEQLEEIKNRELGARYMIPQYISDTNQILDEVSSVLPVLKFKTNTFMVI
jgi:hypothetical protein